MKKLIKLTESDLHRIIKESVNKMLREAEYDVNSDEWKSNFDLGAEPDWWKGDEAQTNKEIADYEALPDKARHPYGADAPDFSDRRLYKHGDKLAAKKPNSVLDKLRNKKEMEANKGYGNSFEAFLINVMQLPSDVAKYASKNHNAESWTKNLWTTYNRWLQRQLYGEYDVTQSEWENGTDIPIRN